MGGERDFEGLLLLSFGLGFGLSFGSEEELAVREVERNGLGRVEGGARGFARYRTVGRDDAAKLAAWRREGVASGGFVGAGVVDKRWEVARGGYEAEDRLVW